MEIVEVWYMRKWAKIIILVCFMICKALAGTVSTGRGGIGLSINYRAFFFACQICARINRLKQPGDPLLARLRPLGVMLSNHGRADAQNIGYVLLGPATGENLWRESVAETMRVRAGNTGALSIKCCQIRLALWPKLAEKLPGFLPT
jgi:hypothetical protein